MQEQLRSDALPTAAGWGRSPGALLAFVVALGALVASGSLPGADPASAKKGKRPNIVFIRTDDQTVESMRAMSNVNSRLARYGTRFANGFVNLPVCCPSRATFLTGQYAHNHGTLTNGAPRGGFAKFNADHGGNTLPAWLQRDGYYTAHVGKYMNGYGAPENQTFVPPGWTEWRAAVAGAQSVYDYALNENGTLVQYGSSDADQRSNIARRYRCRMESILSVDEGVSAIVDALKSHGEIGRTLILFTSDNGFFHGEHRVPTGKLRHYEPSSRVPLIVRGPGFPEGRTVRELAINADLTKTILDAAGAEPGLRQDGRSLAGLADHPKRERGRELLIETTTYTAIRNAGFKYVEHHAGASQEAVELYDLEQDPFELTSQHANPAFAPLRARLAARLRALRECAGSSCRTKPRVKIGVRKRRGCSPRRTRARIKGAEASGVGKVAFRVGGRRAGDDSSRPFKSKRVKLKRRRKTKLRAAVEMADGRRVDLQTNARACR